MSAKGCFKPLKRWFSVLSAPALHLQAGYSRKGRGSRALSSAAVVEEVYDDEDGPQDKWEKEQDSEEQEEEPWEREEELMYKE